MRRFGPSPRPGIAYIRRPGAYAVIRRGGAVLVTEQQDTAVEIQLPGGGIDPGETPQAALAREVWEETGSRIRVVAKLGVFQRFTWMPEYGIHAQKICHIYLATPGLRIGPPVEPWHRALWLPAAEAVARLAVDGDAYHTARAMGLPPRRPLGV
ncbi:MAG: NUDIX hydrolase [Pseudomonadota bacterium]